MSRHRAPASRRLFTFAAYGSGLTLAAGVLALLGQRAAPHAAASTPPAAGAVTVQTGAVGEPLSGVQTTTAAKVETSAPLSAPSASRKAPTISVHRSTAAKPSRVAPPRTSDPLIRPVPTTASRTPIGGPPATESPSAVTTTDPAPPTETTTAATTTEPAPTTEPSIFPTLSTPPLEVAPDSPVIP